MQEMSIINQINNSTMSVWYQMFDHELNEEIKIPFEIKSYETGMLML